MKMSDLIRKYQQEKTPVFINGMGVGKISRLEEDFISFEIVNQNENNLSKETMNIPIGRIDSISEGGKEVQKSEEDKSMENALEDL